MYKKGPSEVKKKSLPHFMLLCLLLSGLKQDQLSQVIGSMALKESPPLGYAGMHLFMGTVTLRQQLNFSVIFPHTLLE